MRTLCLVLLFHASLQLQCNKKEITAHVGDEFILTCSYDRSHFRYSKKYWCRGENNNNCLIIMDSDGIVRSAKSRIIDSGPMGLMVKVTDLQIEDTGVYWVGIDKIYVDLMTRVEVVVNEVPVCKPRLWPHISLGDGPTCWGQPVTVHCSCSESPRVHYAWYQQTPQGHILLQDSSNLNLHCGRVKEDSSYYCIASNDMSSEMTRLSVQVLMSAESGCSYIIKMHDQPLYDCADRLTTTTVTTPAPTTCLATEVTVTTSIETNTTETPQTTVQSTETGQTDENLLFTRLLAGLPLWYTLLRWGSFASLLVFLCILIHCTKPKT